MSSDAPHLMIAIPCRNDIRAAERLRDTGKDFVGAVAYMREPPYTPCVSRFVGDEAIPFDPEPDDGLIEADFTGFACILTHRAVVDVIGREHRRPYMQSDPETNKHIRNLPNTDGGRMETQWLAK